MRREIDQAGIMARRLGAGLMVILLLGGCAGEPLGLVGSNPGSSFQTQANAEPVVQTADGKYLAVNCLRRYGLSEVAKTQCSVLPSPVSPSASRDEVRKLDLTTALLLAYLLYPPNYNQTSFCSYYSFGYPCYGYFGYSGSSVSLSLNYTSSYASTSWNSCDSCLNNPFQYACLFGSSWSCVPFSNSYSYYSYGTPSYSGYSSTVTAACAGGPSSPSYAFWDFNSANVCAQIIGSYSQSCRSNVRVGYCSVNSASVGTVSAAGCGCATGARVGSWN